MVNGTRSSHSANEEENNNRRVTRNSANGKIKSLPDVLDTTSLRRSSRETSSKKIINSPSSTQKSGRLEKRPPPTPADKRKSERVEKKKMPSPLRRSGRTRSHSSTSHSDSKSSGSLSSNPKPKKQKSVKQLTLEAKEVNENEEHDAGTPRVIVKRMTARMYRSLFELPKEEPNRIDKPNQGGNNIGDKIDDCSRESHSDCAAISKNGALPYEDGKSKEMRVDSGLSGPVKNLVENNMTLGSLAPFNATTYDTGLAPESIHPDYCREESLQKLVSRNSILDEDLIKNSVGDDGGKKLIPSKSKEITQDVNSVVSATLTKGDNYNLIPGASSLSRLGGNITGTDSPSNATIYEAGLVSKRVQPDCCREETFLSSNSKNSVLLSEDGKSKEMRADSGLSGPMKDLVENAVTLGSLAPSNAVAYETGLASESIQPDCCRDETLQVLVSRNSIPVEDLIGSSVGQDPRGEKPSKRKRITVDMDSDVSISLAKGDNCNLVPDGSCSSLLGGNVTGTDGSCFKQIRLDFRPTVSESCNPSATELQDRDHIGASMLQKDSQIDNEKEAGLITDSNSSVIQLKERLSSHIAYRFKSDSFRFVEYWVPVQISKLQLEQYCSILLSNASILRSSSKGDSVEAVREVLISTRKCCSHPYLVGPELKPSLNKGLEPTEYLDFDLKASGKLQLLDSMLAELRKNDLRVVILFQSIGGSGRVIGNYLEDILRPRFGSDSYERVDKSLQPSKKQAAMKKFNDKNNGRFVFLLETCACLPSIKLSSVDSIIIFDSDWNPMNDIRALQKITLDSQFELIKIFRLYSSFTVEEKALILAKQCKILDINSQSINWSTNHMLLMWGASCLFDELKVFHDDEASASNVKSLFGRPLLNEAMHEFSSLLSQDGEHIHSSNCSTLLKVQQIGATYQANFPLLGELKFRELAEEPPQFFWTKLLEGKQFQWKYLNSSSQRSRKKVHHFDVSVNEPDLVSEGAGKKRRKVNNIVDQPSSKSEDEKLSTGIKAGTSGDLVDRSHGNNVSEPKSRQHSEQRSLHHLLKPEIRKLCDVLLYPDNVKSMTDNFLEYVVKNHHFNRKPPPILQAFQISLCWTAASLLKHKFDPKESLMRAQKDLNFRCKKEEVYYIYSQLRCLKKLFLYRTGNYNDTSSPKASVPSNRAYSCTEAEREVELFKKDMSKSIKEIQKKGNKKLKKLHLLQEEEKQSFRAAIGEEKAKFEGRYKIKSAVIRSCSPNDVTRMEDLRVLNIEYEKGIKELKCQHDMYLKELEDKQLADIQEFQEREAALVEDVKSWAQKELLKILASREPETGVESLQTCDQVLTHNGTKNHFTGGQGHDDRVQVMAETITENSPVSGKRIAHRTTVSLLDREELLGLHGNGFSDRELSPSSGPDDKTLLSLQNQNSDGVPSGILDGHIPAEMQETSNEVDTICVLKSEEPVETPGIVNITDCPQSASSLNPPCMDQISDRDGPVTISISNPLMEQETTDGVPLSISAASVCHDGIEHLTNAVMVDKRTVSAQQEGALKTMTELSQETPVSRTVGVTVPPEQVQQLSIESSPGNDTFGEMQHSSNQPELVSSAVDVVPADQSKHVSQTVKPLEQVQQLPSAEPELPSSHLDSTNFPLATEVEHQPTVVPNQDMLELDSHSHEVVHPTSNSNPNTVTPNEVRMQSSDTINLATPLEISYQQMQAETHTISRMHLSYDPLKNELDRIQKVTEQTMKNYEDKKLLLKTDFEKELEELRRKYDVKFQRIEVEFEQRKTTLDTNLNVVHVNKFLADAFRSKCSTLKPSSTSGMPQDSSFAQQQLLQSSRQQSASWSSLLAGSSAGVPSGTSLRSPSTTAIRAGYSPSGFPTNISATSPIINTISLPVANLQTGGQIRAPAPHLRPYRP